LSLFFFSRTENLVSSLGGTPVGLRYAPAACRSPRTTANQKTNPAKGDIFT
jgi:hypothetical protein